MATLQSLEKAIPARNKIGGRSSTKVTSAKRLDREIEATKREIRNAFSGQKKVSAKKKDK